MRFQGYGVFDGDGPLRAVFRLHADAHDFLTDSCNWEHYEERLDDGVIVITSRADYSIRKYLRPCSYDWHPDTRDEQAAFDSQLPT